MVSRINGKSNSLLADSRRRLEGGAFCEHAASSNSQLCFMNCRSQEGVCRTLGLVYMLSFNGVGCGGLSSAAPASTASGAVKKASFLKEKRSTR
jgi:hypothetical protein